MMPSCKQVAQLLSSDGLGRASLATRLVVTAHLAMCRHCARFRDQIRLLGAAVRATHRNASIELPGTETLEERITRNLLGRSS